MIVALVIVFFFQVTVISEPLQPFLDQPIAGRFSKHYRPDDHFDIIFILKTFCGIDNHFCNRQILENLQIVKYFKNNYIYLSNSLKI